MGVEMNRPRITIHVDCGGQQSRGRSSRKYKGLAVPIIRFHSIARSDETTPFRTLVSLEETTSRLFTVGESLTSRNSLYVYALEIA